MGNSIFVEYVCLLDDMGLINRKLYWVILKDIVIVLDGGYIIIRFYVINLGIRKGKLDCFINVIIFFLIVL